MSVKEIARTVGVAPSSVSLWVRDIPLTPEQVESLRLRNPAYNDQLRGATRNAERGRERRLAAQARGRETVRLGDPLYIAGVMLYWAEGSKTNRHTASVSNSDPEVLRTFMRFLRGCLGVPDCRIAVTCNLFADHAERQIEIEQFWLDVLQLPRSRLCRSTVNTYSSTASRSGPTSCRTEPLEWPCTRRRWCKKSSARSRSSAGSSVPNGSGSQPCTAKEPEPD